MKIINQIFIIPIKLYKFFLSPFFYNSCKFEPSCSSYCLECFEKYNIEARPLLAGNFLKNPVIEHLDHIVPYECNNADYIDENGVMLGNYNRDMTDEMKLFEACMEEFFYSI